MYCRTALALAACFVGIGCNRQPAEQRVERIAILRFENLSSDLSADWMGRAFSEVITAELAGNPHLYAVPSAQLHSFSGNLGVRPISAPGISAERTLGIVAGANELAFGEYAMQGGRLRAWLAIEDPATGKIIKTLSVSGGANDIIGAASELARQISGRIRPYPAKNPESLKAFAEAIESGDPHVSAVRLNQAIAADPDFGPAYLLLAQITAPRDRAAAIGFLERGLARGNAIPGLERARIQLDLAALRNDSAGQRQALAAVAKMDPGNPRNWLALAGLATSRHDYRQAVDAFQHALAIEPENALALNQLAYAYAYGGDLNGGVAALRRYRALRPNDPNALDSLGDIYLLTGNPRQAENFYLQAFKKDANFLEGGDLFKAAMARLMTGDIPGADALANQYADARTAAHDAAVDYRRAEWLWISGRRNEGYRKLEEFVQRVETGPLHELASRGYAELSSWSLMRGERDTATKMADKAAARAGPATQGTAIIAHFLAQPPASAAEWAARADKLVANPAQENTAKDLALAYALLLNKEFAPAAAVFQRLYDNGSANEDEGLPVLLAWTLIETGRVNEAAPLLQRTPIPPPTGVSPYTPFYLPRIFYLRGAVAEKQGRRDEAAKDYKLFLLLSGAEPLMWGEEQAARAALGRL